jgi:protein-tyrosine-phosphatase/DNA-binding transcriptional ArsR family regulator
MLERDALSAFAALSQETRLRVLRLLVRAGEAGMAAGAIGEAVGASSSGLSFHLSHLERAGLIEGRRESRSIVYRVRVEALSDLVRFLLEECCEGRPEICAPVLRSLPMPNRVYNVLFLCSGNSARSIMAESLLRKEGGGRFRAFSAGSRPKGAVDPLALKVLDAFDMPTDGLRSKSWAEFAEPGAPELDFVFTVCDAAAGEPCPVWPGQPMTAHWGIEDPAAVEGALFERERAFGQAFRYLKNRISAFISLPLASLDRLALSKKLDEIGTLTGASSGAVVPFDRESA